MSLARSRPLDRECEHVIDVRHAEREHGNPIETQRNPCAVREPGLKRAQEMFVDRYGRQPTPSAFLTVMLEARPLLASGSQLLKAIRELDAVGVQLEAQGRSWLREVQSRERSLRCRIVMHKGQ